MGLRFSGDLYLTVDPVVPRVFSSLLKLLLTEKNGWIIQTKLKLFYDFLAINMISLSSAGWIKKLSGLYTAPGP